MSAEVLALPQPFLHFRLGGKDFGFEARFLREAAAAVSFTEVPLNGRHLVGVTQLHGKIIPVLDLAGLLELPEVFPPGEFVTIYLPGPPEMMAGFAVEAVVGFVKVAAENTGKAGKGLVGAGYIRSGMEEEKFLWLDIEKLIADQLPGNPRDTESRD